MNPIALLNSLPGAVSQGLIWGIMAIGVYLTYRILDVADLTVDGTMCTGGAVFIMLTMAGWSIPAALLASFVAGMLAGLCTGLLHTACGIPAILSGILTQLALYSVNLRIMGKANQPINANNYKLLVSSRNVKVLSLQNPIFVVGVFAIALIAILYWFFGTELGCSMRSTGSNGHMSRAQGINTNFTTVLGLMLSNGLVALSAALLSQYQGFADVNMGRGAIVIGLAAVIIGDVIFGKIFTNFGLKLLSVVFGAIIYYVVYSFVIWLGMSGDDMKLITSVIVALFLSIPYWKGKYFTKAKNGGKIHA
ncbi:MAG: ABC transporter permease [Oscillibacter sp.]|nr:ABC transporter permease [Oscillibacter sp.]